jgi:hypothetical protein
LLAPALVLSAALPVYSQNLTTGSPQLTSTNATANGLSGLLGGSGVTATPTATATTPGVLAFELLRGNGTGSGYILTHTAVLAETLSVHAGGRKLQAGQDYLFDAGTGNLYFLQPITGGDVISVSYRYLDGADAQKQFAPSAPGLLLNLGQSTQMGLMLGITTANGLGYNSTLSGMALNSSFGAGSLSHYSGMAYYSNLQANTNQSLNIHPASGTTTPAAKVQTGQDMMLVQSLGLQSGGTRFNIDFQNVGKNFTGFSALKLSNAGNKSALDQLTALEGEKGIKRLGFGMGVGQNAKSTAPTGLNFNFNQIQDAKSAINQMGAAYNSTLLNFHYNTREVGQHFTQFAGLREADKTQ